MCDKALVHECLIAEDAEIFAILEPAVRNDLVHIQANQFFLGVYPVVSAPATPPFVLPRAAHGSLSSDVSYDGETQAKARPKP